MHFTYKREAAICLLITKVDSKCDSGLRRFNGKVHEIIYCIWDRVGQDCQQDPAVEARGSERTPWLSKQLLRDKCRYSWIQI